MKRWQIFLGLLLIVLGLFSLIDLFFQINLWRYIGPLLLVALGVWLILRPQLTGADVKVQMPIIGDVRKAGPWEATKHEIWILVGSNRLDFTEASFPNGEAVIKIFSFVADVKVILPEDVGLSLESNSFASELKGFTEKEERTLNSLEFETPGYEAASKRVKLQIFGFVSEIRLKRPLM